MRTGVVLFVFDVYNAPRFSNHHPCWEPPASENKQPFMALAFPVCESWRAACCSGKKDKYMAALEGLVLETSQEETDIHCLKPVKC